MSNCSLLAGLLRRGFSRRLKTLLDKGAKAECVRWVCYKSRSVYALPGSIAINHGVPVNVQLVWEAGLCPGKGSLSTQENTVLVQWEVMRV